MLTLDNVDMDNVLFLNVLKFLEMRLNKSNKRIIKNQISIPFDGIAVENF